MLDIILVGRTTRTFRMRTLELRERLLSIFRTHEMKSAYKEAWERINMFSSAASAMNFSDTNALIIYCMLLDIMVQLEKLEADFEKKYYDLDS